MGWQITGRARVNPESPKSFGVCDRCGFLWNRMDLSWQYEWQFQKILNKRILVCPECRDKLQDQLRRIVLPPDPVPIANPRVGEFGSMIFSSNPNEFATITPSFLGTEGATDALGQVTGRLILVTELSCIPIVTEVTETPYPQGRGDDSYTRGSANTANLNALLGGNST